ncbi:amino acid ABC transporter permease [Paenibacillus sp. NEAU-GSW1]|uniref:amino acid ABC transporter permease n=1 Tax=Paenibacillus sp. NEAU-GSW1 TaxID=2682486 RepID=UPI0012E31363|nr:amino acid ABC transporter permease [Paenibacillus sp. NEAU-GSW1]MUT66491.1 ABC transporter permease subunit [Paenibacillus sp. NEAU-GSW1]
MEKLIDFNYIWKTLPSILAHLPVTVSIAVGSMALGIIIGLFAALARMYKVPVVGRLAAVYVSFVRGTPLLVQIYLIFYGIPKVIYFFQTEYGWFQGFDANVMAPELFALLSFSFNLGAYLSETIRSAILSVDRGQFEAASAIGMSQTQTMVKIILPQALTTALPNLGNTFISTIKDTSLVFVIGVVDIMGQAKIIGARGLAYFEVYIAVAAIYWILCIVIEKVLARVEKRIRIYERSVVS